MCLMTSAARLECSLLFQRARPLVLRAQDLGRFMLQFGTHFCMKKFLEFAVSHVLMQTSSHDFFWANAGTVNAGTNASSRPSASATSGAFVIFLPKNNAENLSRRQVASHVPAGGSAIIYATVMPGAYQANHPRMYAKERQSNGRGPR